MNGEDHDILIEIRSDIKHVRKELIECNQKYERLRHDVDFHDRWINRAKGHISAIVAFLTIFGGMLLYFVLR